MTGKRRLANGRGVAGCNGPTARFEIAVYALESAAASNEVGSIMHG